MIIPWVVIEILWVEIVAESFSRIISSPVNLPSISKFYASIPDIAVDNPIVFPATTIFVAIRSAVATLAILRADTATLLD